MSIVKGTEKIINPLQESALNKKGLCDYVVNVAAGLEFASSIMTKSSWGECFKRQWDDIETAAIEVGCEDRLHIWPDPELKGYVDEAKIAHWLYKPTVEKWNSLTTSESKAKYIQPIRHKSQTPITTS